jgi:hypothetical protein
VRTERELVVDHAPPVIVEPVVQVDVQTSSVVVTAPVEDAVSGVQDAVLTPGDGPSGSRGARTRCRRPAPGSPSWEAPSTCT